MARQSFFVFQIELFLSLTDKNMDRRKAGRRQIQSAIPRALVF